MLSEGDVEGLRWVIITRVSTKSQVDNRSLDEQSKQLQSKRQRLDGTLTKQFQVAESATTLDRGTINETLEMARNDEFDVLAIHKMDRLTRADPWDAIDLLKELSDNDIILYEGVHGPYDWDDFNDFRRLVDQVVFSRQNVLAIRDGQKRGYQGPLQDGEWPFGIKNPAGTKLGPNRELRLKEGAKKVIPEIFDHYLKTKVITKTHEFVNDEILPEGEIMSLSEGQVRRILSNELFIGKMYHMGEVMAKNTNFRLISEYKFEKVQEIRAENNNTSRSEDAKEIDHELKTLNKLEAFSERFGPHHTFMNVLPFEPICEECGSPMEWDKSRTGLAKGLDVPRFECSTCEHRRNIPNESDLDKIHQTLPLRCPYCIGADEFKVEDDSNAVSRFDYMYTCEVCGKSWGSNITPDKYRRFIENHDIGFSLNDNTSSNETDVDIDPGQKTLT